MSSRKRSLSKEEIDKAVVAQADDESAWEEPVRVRPAKFMSLALPSELAVRAAFCARLTRAPSVGDWLRRIVQERVELEEAAFAQSQRLREVGGRVEDASPPQKGQGRRPGGHEAGAKATGCSKRRA
jgi:hypothetical protein